MSAPIFALDTSCMVAAVCTWHEQHAASAAEINRRLERGERLTVSAPALAETYAVLTRLPAPYRLDPADAWELLEANFVARRQIFALGSAQYVATLRELSKSALGGGRTYDAVIAACAREAKATTLLTFNRRHFEPPPEGIEVIEPS